MVAVGVGATVAVGVGTAVGVEVGSAVGVEGGTAVGVGSDPHAAAESRSTMANPVANHL